VKQAPSYFFVLPVRFSIGIHSQRQLRLKTAASMRKRHDVMPKNFGKTKKNILFRFIGPIQYWDPRSRQHTTKNGYIHVKTALCHAQEFLTTTVIFRAAILFERLQDNNIV
jgi:hypothetical protein